MTLARIVVAADDEVADADRLVPGRLCGGPVDSEMSALLIFRLHPARLHQQRPAHIHRRAARTRSRPGRSPNDLRRLKTRNLITRIDGTHRYRVTDHGLETAKFLTRVQDHVLRCGLAELATATPTPGRLRSAANAYRTAVENLTTAA
jgi:hypothetical protein